MIGYYNFTVILTYGSVVSAIIGIIAALNGDVKCGLLCLMACGLCDMFDGSVARLKKDRTAQEVSFGVHIDSLSDVVAFGVLPATILFGLGVDGPIGYIIAIFYVLAAVIRLAYFDVQEMFEVEKDKNQKRKYFKGLPVTNASIILPAAMALFSFFNINCQPVYAIFLLATGIMFLVPFKMKKLYLPWLIIPAVAGVAVALYIIFYGGNFGVA